MHAPSPSSTPPLRIEALDVARGVALAAMASYHFAWDLSVLRLIATDVIAEPAWRWFARSIAGTFLLLVGASLALAHGRGVRCRAFLRRLGTIGAAALAVTVATWIAFPATYIFFGILHCIAVASVLALPFLRAPWPLVVLLSAACLAAPRLFTSAILDHPGLDWLGLGQRDPITNDYVPIFPWLGVVLIGTLPGRAILRAISPDRAGAGRALLHWHAQNPLARALAFAGRHSLAVYLLHQPILFGLLWAIVQVTGPNPRAEEAAFLRECSASCVATARGESSCRAACACVAGRLTDEGLWQPYLRRQIPPDDQPRITALARPCFATPQP